MLVQDHTTRKQLSQGRTLEAILLPTGIYYLPFYAHEEMPAHPLSLAFPTHSADRNWYHLWTGGLFGSWKLPLFPCPGSTWTGLLIPRVREEEMPKHWESQEEADTGSWKVPVPRCSQQNTPGLRFSCLRDGPTLIFPLHFSAPRGDPEGSSLVSRQVTGEPHRATKNQNQSVWGRSSRWAWAPFFGIAFRAPIVSSPFQEVSTVLDIGSWSLPCLSLPSALTAALLLQWLAEPELYAPH